VRLKQTPLINVVDTEFHGQPTDEVSQCFLGFDYSQVLTVDDFAESNILSANAFATWTQTVMDYLSFAVDDVPDAFAPGQIISSVLRYDVMRVPAVGIGAKMTRVHSPILELIVESATNCGDLVDDKEARASTLSHQPARPVFSSATSQSVAEVTMPRSQASHSLVVQAPTSSTRTILVLRDSHFHENRQQRSFDLREVCSSYTRCSRCHGEIG